MKNITESKCIELIQEAFPDFSIYWDDFIKYYDLDDGFIFQMIPFSKYVVYVIKSNDTEKIKKIFHFVELLLTNGDESVQTATTTGFLESLLNKDPHEIQFRSFVKYMGPESIEYCRAWDKFSGVKTDGLWDDENGSQTEIRKASAHIPKQPEK